MLKEIPLKNGMQLSRVMISTALGIDGAGIFPHTLKPSYRNLLSAVKETEIVAIGKSFTFKQRVGNFQLSRPWTYSYIQKIGSDGILNAYGLTNPGLEKSVFKISKSVNCGNRIIPSFFPEFSNGIGSAIFTTKAAVTLLLDALGSKLTAIEINISCPNMKKEVINKNVSNAIALAREIRTSFPHLTIIFKISIVHPYELAHELEHIGIDIIHAINTIPFSLVFPDKISPLANVGGGGVSGGPAKNQAMKYNYGLRKEVSLPIIMGCGICTHNDVVAYEDIGANAVVICTTALRNPQITAELINEFNTRN